MDNHNPAAPKLPVPSDWPRIAPALHYDRAGEAIDWLCRVFGFEVRLRVEGEGGAIVHSELEYGDGLIMVAGAGPVPGRRGPVGRSPLSVGGANTQVLCVYVDDVDAHCAHAREAGAEILEELRTDDYGPEYGTNRCYSAQDPEGHRWWFMTRLSNPVPRAS